MDALISAGVGFARWLAINLVFFAIGWVVLKVLTLGRYPRSWDPRRPDSVDHTLCGLVGLLSVVGLALLLARLGIS